MLPIASPAESEIKTTGRHVAFNNRKDGRTFPGHGVLGSNDEGVS